MMLSSGAFVYLLVEQFRLMLESGIGNIDTNGCCLADLP
jgi:hypothetical protein